MTDGSGTRFVSFRVDKELKTTLEHIAINSDRSITQLCRYALSTFLLSDVSITELDVRPEGKEDEATLDELIGVRLSPELLNDVTSSVPEASISSVVRAIVAWWVHEANLEELGGPVMRTSASRKSS